MIVYNLYRITTLHDDFEQELQDFTDYVDTAAQVQSNPQGKSHKQKHH